MALVQDHFAPVEPLQNAHGEFGLKYPTGEGFTMPFSTADSAFIGGFMSAGFGATAGYWSTPPDSAASTKVLRSAKYGAAAAAIGTAHGVAAVALRSTFGDNLLLHGLTGAAIGAGSYIAAVYAHSS